MFRLAALCGLCCFPLLAWSAEPTPPTKTERPLEVKLTDDSVVKLTLVDSSVEFTTPHGKLTIPLKDIRKIELGLRIPEDAAMEITAAITDLGSMQAKKRDEATLTLLKQREKSYPALKLAAKSTDAEVAKLASGIIEKLKIAVPEARLEVSEFDIIHTDTSKIAGKIASPTLKAKSFALGDVQLRLVDVLVMNLPGQGEDDERALAAVALPNPGSLSQYQDRVGQTFVFKVTGAASGSLWGTENYTLDSSLARAAVQMGVLKVGQTGYVKVTVMGPMVNFIGSTRNGVLSSSFDSYPGAYRVHTK